MTPGDLIKVDPTDGSSHVVLTKLPEPFHADNQTLVRLERDEIGLLLALIIVETDVKDGWECGGKHLEALVLFGQRLGWNNAMCFSVA